MTWELVITSAAARDLGGPSRADRASIDEAFSAMRTRRFSGDTRLFRTMETAYRRRVGNWWIFFEQDSSRNLIIILSVKRRQSRTY